MKIYRDLGLYGAYIDLDGYFVNSLEDTIYFAPDLNIAVPEDCNINQKNAGKQYIMI